jgi:hypothetical protein
VISGLGEASLRQNDRRMNINSATEAQPPGSVAGFPFTPNHSAELQLRKAAPNRAIPQPSAAIRTFPHHIIFSTRSVWFSAYRLGPAPRSQFAQPYIPPTIRTIPNLSEAFRTFPSMKIFFAHVPSGFALWSLAPGVTISGCKSAARRKIPLSALLKSPSPRRIPMWSCVS